MINIMVNRHFRPVLTVRAFLLSVEEMGTDAFGVGAVGKPFAEKTADVVVAGRERAVIAPGAVCPLDKVGA